MSNQVQQQPPTWGQVIDRAAPQFNEIASRNKLVTWAEESQFALQAIQKNDKLAQCMAHTVQNAIINVASVGLTLNPAMGYAYLVPEGVKQPNAGNWPFGAAASMILLTMVLIILLIFARQQAKAQKAEG